MELDDGGTGGLWTDHVTVTAPGTEVLVRYRTGAHAGRPAVTRRPTGGGSAAYVSTRLGSEGLAALPPRLPELAGVTANCPPPVRGRVRDHRAPRPGGRFLFLVNRTDEAVTVPGLIGEVLVGDTGDEGAVVLAGRGSPSCARPPTRRTSAPPTPPPRRGTRQLRGRSGSSVRTRGDRLTTDPREREVRRKMAARELYSDGAPGLEGPGGGAARAARNWPTPATGPARGTRRGAGRS